MNDILNAIHNAPSFAALDDLSRLIWKEWGAQKLSDDLAQSLAEAIHARRGDMKTGGEASARPTASPQRISYFPPKRKRPLRPDRRASIFRRRLLAASGPMPPTLAQQFTTGELAALRIVADEVRDNQTCRLSIGEIAARAGIGETTTRNALRMAAKAKLLTVTERRRPRQRSLTNVIEIISREWKIWIARGQSQKNHAGRPPESGFKKTKATDKLFYHKNETKTKTITSAHIARTGDQASNPDRQIQKKVKTPHSPIPF